MATAPKVLFGFHAVGVRLKTAPASVIEVYIDVSRRDARMRQFLDRCKELSVRIIDADALRLAKLSGGHGHQGVVARVQQLEQTHSLDTCLEQISKLGKKGFIALY